MPFRTRRQKEAAEKRRYVLGREAIVSYEAKDSNITSQSTSTHKYEIKRITETTYTKRDLLKIVAFASIIIVAQALLRLTLS